MEDRKLLELAAKAAGYDLHLASEDGTAIDYIRLDPNYSWMPLAEWNPLTDDGDALRLAVKLRMGVTHNDPRDQATYASADVSWFVAPIFKGFTATEEFEDEIERGAATRRAIVRAAAALGKEQP